MPVTCMHAPAFCASAWWQDSRDVSPAALRRPRPVRQATFTHAGSDSTEAAVPSSGEEVKKATKRGGKKTQAVTDRGVVSSEGASGEAAAGESAAPKKTSTKARADSWVRGKTRGALENC
jgi:hypothetical protein